jgi:hypothetical protein
MSMPTDNATRAEQMKKEDLFAFNDLHLLVRKPRSGCILG